MKMSGTPTAENTRRPSLAQKAFRRASKSWEDDSGISDLKETIEKVKSRRSTMEMGAGEDADKYSLRPGCNIRFLKDDVEWAFQSQWRSTGIFGGFLVVAIVFFIFLALFTYPYSITPLENGVLSGIMIGYSVISLVIMIVSRDFFMRHYDFIVSSTVVVICVGNLVIAYLSRVSAVEFPLNDSCMHQGARRCTLRDVCGLLFFVSTPFGSGFTMRDCDTSDSHCGGDLVEFARRRRVDLIGFMNQIIAVALIIWGGLDNSAQSRSFVAQNFPVITDGPLRMKRWKKHCVHAGTRAAQTSNCPRKSEDVALNSRKRRTPSSIWVKAARASSKSWT